MGSRTAGCLGLVVVLACGAGCGEPPAPPPPPSAPPVRVEAVTTAAWTPTAEAVTTLEAVRRATLRAESAGRVVERPVAPGERVEAGDVLLRLDVGRAATAVQAASAQVAQAEAALAQAERQRTLAAQLVQAGGAPRGRLDDADDAVRLARSAVDAARAQTRLTRRGLTEAVLRAPFAGTVAECLVQEGEFVAPGAPVMLLVDPSALEARALLDPRDALDLAEGARAHVEAHARPGERFGAHVERVGDVVDARTRRLPVTVRVDDPEQRLRPGLAARVQVELGAPREVVTVPQDAVFERYEQTHVYVVEGDDAPTALRRAVVLGRARDGRFAIEEGLRAGERVVVAGIDRVVHDRRVQVVEAVARRGEEPEPDPEPTAEPNP